MKSFRISILVVAAALMIMGIAGTTYAFHDGGVATCESCHTMHNSLNGSIVMLSKFGSNYASNPTEFNNATQFLLHGSDQSSTCLNCHASNDAAGAESSYHIMSEAPGGIPSERTPGGDFAWLTVSGTGTVNPANHHGHNIVAADFGLTSSTNYAANGNVSPGGSYPIAKLYCSSCHNPHSDYRYDSGGNLVQRTIGANVGPIIGSGSYGNSGALPPAGETIGVYRFLGGAGYIPKSISASNPSAAFTAAPPIAVAPSSYNKSESGATLNNNEVVRVAYGSGMSEWCGNCHSGIVNGTADIGASGAQHRHPAGAAAILANTTEGGNEAGNYNAYLGSGDLAGTQSSSYNSLVPYEEGVGMANYTTSLYSHASATAGGSGSGPITGTENVMCLSCHRAHASAFPEMTRWDAQAGEMIVEMGQYTGTDNTSTGASRTAAALGYSQAQLQAAYYDRNPATTFAYDQRSLCNKCHAKD